MSDWLVKHALSNTWCKPSIDRRLIAKGGRLSRKTGELFGMTITRYSVRLPIDDRWFHVFQLGNLGPEFYEIRIGNQWARMDRVVNDSGTLITLYKENGEVYPCSKAWIRKLPNQNVIVAIEDYSQLPSYTEDALYLQFYVGLFTDTSEFLEENKPRIFGDVVRNPTEATQMVLKYNEWKTTLPGYTKAYVNGMGVKDFTTDTFKLWDYIELVYDGLVEHVYRIPVNHLESFDSLIDECRKYLLLPTTDTDTIRFINDVDVELSYGNETRFYNQHKSKDLRQVTHNAYSLPTTRIQKLLDITDGWDDVSKLEIILKVHHSGMDRPLEFEHNRLHELYKLPIDKIKQAMTGANSMVPEWRASYLENSSYNHIMAASFGNINLPLCTEAYGYNSISKMVADTPVKADLVNDKKVVIAPPLLSRNSTAIEYDINGLYLGHHPCINLANDVYTATDMNCELVDFIEGQVDVGLDIHYNQQFFQLDEANNYRFYINKIVSGTNTNIYTDVTGNEDYYTVSEDGVVTWTFDRFRERAIIVSDKNLLSYCITGDLSDGKLDTMIMIKDEDDKSIPCPYEFEHLTVIMNKHTLVPGVDYHVEWPRVIISNKRFLEAGANYNYPKLVFIARGLTDKYVEPPYGFVRNGVLSDNCHFDVRDDKVVNINVGGHIYHREDLKFREDMRMSVRKELNGLPYSITDPVIPLRSVADGNTYELRERSKELDGRVEDYLSVYLPTPPIDDENPITSQYHVFSPIMNKVISDMKRLVLIVRPDENNHLTTQHFDELMERYIDMLPYEPIRRNVDLRYIVVHPHAYNTTIELSEIEYSFVERLNSRYLGGKIVLNNHLMIKA